MIGRPDTVSSQLPSISVTVPVVVPLTKTLAPMSGSPVPASRMDPGEGGLRGQAAAKYYPRGSKK